MTFRRHAAALAVALAATRAEAATGPFFTMNNTDFVVVLAFLLFIAVLLYFKVPSRLTAMLDKRSEGIRANLNEARSLREEAQSLLASYERKQNEVQAQADRIVESAKVEANEAADRAKADLAASIERRLKAAEDQIESAQANAVREVRDRAIQVAVAAAAEVLARNMDEGRGNALIEESLGTVKAKLH